MLGAVIYLIPIFAFCFWIIWMRGAETLEEHWAGWFLVGGLEAREIRFGAVITLIVTPIYFFLG